MKDSRANLLLLTNLMREEGSDPSEFRNYRENARKESNTKSFCRGDGIFAADGRRIFAELADLQESRGRGEIGLTGEDTITTFGAVGRERVALGIENFEVQRMEFSVERWRSEAECIFVAQNFGDAAVNGGEFFALGREKRLTAAGSGERLECAVCDGETQARRRDGV